MATVKDMDRLLQSFVDNGLPGCGLKIVQRGNVVYEGYFGKADLATGAPVTDTSVFRHAKKRSDTYGFRKQRRVS